MTYRYHKVIISDSSIPTSYSKDLPISSSILTNNYNLITTLFQKLKTSKNHKAYHYTPFPMQISLKYNKSSKYYIFSLKQYRYYTNIYYIHSLFTPSNSSNNKQNYIPSKYLYHSTVIKFKSIKDIHSLFISITKIYKSNNIYRNLIKIK